MVDAGEAVGVLLVGAIIVSIFITGGFSGGTTGAGTADLGILGGSQSIQTDYGESVESIDRVRASLNDSVALTGAPDSNVTIDSSADLGHDFSACTWGTLNSSVVTADEDGLLLATQSAVVWYNGTSDTWDGYYYNTSSRNSFRASVAAPSPDTPTLVCLNHGTQTLNVSANTTVGSDVATGSSNTATYPANVSGWHGTVEETRLYGSGPLNTSQRTEWVGEPALAVAGPAPSTRVTYDTRSTSIPSSFDVYFATGSASVSNASLATGQTAPAIAAGTDYSTSGDTVSILGGGQLDADGEVLYVDYELGGGLGPSIARLAILLVVFLGLAVLVERSL